LKPVLGDQEISDFYSLAVVFTKAGDGFARSAWDALGSPSSSRDN